MKKKKYLSLLLIGIFYLFAVSFGIIQQTIVENDDTQSSFSLSGTIWSVSGRDDCYFTIVFTSENSLEQEGYYIENGQGFGAWTSSYSYNFDGNSGEIRLEGGGRKVANFYLTKDHNGNYRTMILKTFAMEPGDAEEVFTLIKQR
jgi:hypothetical protein